MPLPPGAASAGTWNTRRLKELLAGRRVRRPAYPGGGSGGPEPLPGEQQLKGTIKDRVLAILARNPDGLTSSQILNNLRVTGLPTLARESLSPQLSRLRNADQKIALSHGIWTLRKAESHGG